MLTNINKRKFLLPVYNLSTEVSKFKKYDPDSFISQFRVQSFVVLVFVSVCQLAFFPSPTIFFAILCCLFVWRLTCDIFLNRKMLFNYPLSSFLIFGYTLTQFYFPMLFTLLEGKSILYNLNVPEQDFLHSTLAFCVLVVVHFFYRQFSSGTKNRKKSILLKIGLFEPPSEKHLWLIGCFGLFVSFINVLFFVNAGNEGLLGKLFFGFYSFMYAPFFIPISLLFSGRTITSKNFTSKIIVYTIFIFALSIIRNTRGAFMFGFTSLVFSYILGLFLGIFEPKIFTKRNIIIAAIGFFLITGPFSDLGIAMLIVRGQRTTLSSSELFQRTVDAYQDKEALSEYKFSTSKAQVIDNSWDESYLDNIFLSRFCNLKFNDMSLELGNKMTVGNKGFVKFQFDRVWSLLPSPLLNVLKISVDKKTAGGESIGDYLYSITTGSLDGLGTYRTGSFYGTGYISFGWWYLAIFGALMLPVFLLLDKMVINVKGMDFYGIVFTTDTLCLSVNALVLITSIFQFLPVEGVLDLMSFTIRNWLQNLVIYLLIFKVTKVFA